MQPLTKQETKISRLISQGFYEKEIAEKLYISEHTVHTHYKNIRKKLGAKNIADITRMYILSLPKASDVLKVLCTLVFLVIQAHIILVDTDIEMRRVKVQTRVVRLKSNRKDS